MHWTVVATPVGDLSIAADGAAICRIHFGPCPGSPVRRDDSLLTAAATQLAEYFAGRRTEFELPLASVGGSEFDRAVWAHLATIPYGEMRTYGEVAAAVGDRSAARAVGVACNRNRLPVLLPCHRVVGAGGKLVGFGGGLPRKRLLLELEARVRVESDFGL
ncbi:methylated-DNA--[protein]-cysteine S-methyltransferase [Planosporangium flavigriseum]|uniref:Methylated-DNA--protein-cysteine methyltransferase n=1 Tax=Planosporangium flavigriseum TaxID=373681 RepID=A0A8J3PKD5_9ACTN|nr:methylated-DNA--[protein]-cysteine S-methyltransferase [Planosporangium flavigriseum]NJC64488.1 methylated-DNA--[protein]-cysteine S-methyltransferase [Planosporangium flavigriseum]GIG72034.1 methylated-DNA--protein-cysteine methyltransferase [Planosporangium flavigriseum]